mgnify:CR=1 FL=1
MATQAIDATIFASTHPDIAKRTSVSGLTFFSGNAAVRYPYIRINF